MIHRLIGFWVIRRAMRILTADDPRPLRARLTHEAKRILIGAAITLALLVVGAIVLVVVLIALVYLGSAPWTPERSDARRSVRTYADRPVPRYVLERIASAAVSGPSAGFSQGLRIVVVTDPNTRRLIATAAMEDDLAAKGGTGGRRPHRSTSSVLTREQDYTPGTRRRTSWRSPADGRSTGPRPTGTSTPAPPR